MPTATFSLPFEPSPRSRDASGAVGAELAEPVAVLRHEAVDLGEDRALPVDLVLPDGHILGELQVGDLVVQLGACVGGRLVVEAVGHQVDRVGEDRAPGLELARDLGVVDGPGGHPVVSFVLDGLRAELTPPRSSDTRRHLGHRPPRC